MEFTKNLLRLDDSLQNICHDWTMVLTKYPPGFDVVLWKIGQLYQQKISAKIKVVSTRNLLRLDNGK